jgi:DNA helicase TIP49 (TBP-interacting protein)
MKLRCSANGIRLRVDEADLEKLLLSNSVSVMVPLPPGKGLRYTLELLEVAQIVAKFEYDEIRVTLPRNAALQWINTDQVGMAHSMLDLNILIEKDFPCGHTSLPPKA